MTTLFLIALFAVLGALWRRWLGSDHPGRWVVLPAGLMLAAVAVASTGAHWAIALAVAALTVPYWLLGHGSYMDLGTSPAGDNERIRPIMRWIEREFAVTMGSEAYDLIGLTLRYTLPALPIAAALVFHRWWGLAFVLVGPLTAGAYWLAWQINDSPTWSGKMKPTVWGEYAAGALFCGALALVG